MHTPLIYILSFLFFTSSLFAQEQASIFDHLSSEEVLEMTIEANFDSIIANKYKADYWDAKMIVEGKAPENWDIKMRTRGRYRRRICEFPPIKLEFSKKDLAARGLYSFDDLKLVTHCLNNAQSDNTVLREALAYDLYELLTPESFRHQVVKITYINTGEKRYKIKRYGVLIEEDRNLAYRLDGEVLDTFGLAWQNVEPLNAELAACYQYMVGNTDWNIEMQRNLKFIQKDQTGTVIAVPYDFDMSGLVNPVYGIPNPDVPITSLQDRYYLGLTKPSQETIDLLLSKKDDLLTYCKKYKILNGAHRAEVYKFIESFYEELEKGDAFMNEEK
ncbi:MAG: hypothetical protein AAGI23_11435 [Bacteroidota bacterium]